MPIYEYRCEECGQRFDAFFRRTEDAEKDVPSCKRCGSRKVRKMFSVIGLGNPAGGGTLGDCGTRST